MDPLHSFQFTYCESLTILQGISRARQVLRSFLTCFSFIYIFFCFFFCIFAIAIYVTFPAIEIQWNVVDDDDANEAVLIKLQLYPVYLTHSSQLNTKQ